MKLKLALLMLVGGMLTIPAHAQFSRINSITLQDDMGTQEAFYASPFTIKAGADCEWSITGTVATFNCAGSGGSPAGADGNLQYNNMGAFGGADNSVVTAATGAIALTQDANGVTQLRLNGIGAFSPTAPVLGIFNAATAPCVGLVGICGDGDATAGALLALFADDDNSYAFSILNRTYSASAFAGLSMYVSNAGVPTILGGGVGMQITATGGDVVISANAGAGNVQANHYAGLVDVTAESFLTETNCTNSATPSVCGAAASGAFVVAAGDTSHTVSTTNVKTNSNIIIVPNTSTAMGTRLGVTCNTTVSLPVVSAQVASTGFTVTVAAAPVTDPGCYTYFIVN